MFKKLRVKFIAINMLLITLVLLIGFSTISVVNYNSLKLETLKDLDRVLAAPKRNNSFKPEIGYRRNFSFPMIPIFIVELDSSDDIKAVNTNNVTISDNNIEKAIDNIKESNKNTGVIEDLNLRYKKIESPNGSKIALADISREINSFSNLLFTLITIGILTLIIFFIISLFLSKWALAPVKKSWEQQKQFLADASHELKTPLTVILTNLKILESHKSSTIQEELKWIENSNQEALRMKALLDSMLFLARSDYSQTPELHSKVDFSDVVIGKVLTFESIAYENGLTIKENIENNLFIDGDLVQLNQLISTLLDNACKYSKRDTEIEVNLFKSQSNIILMINNIGNPISENDLSHIFERFYRSEESRSREQGGYGLGLSIAKNIVELHEGSIKAKNYKNDGNSFIVTLPSTSK